MFQRFTTPEELYHFKLGAALTMERAAEEILEVNVKNAESGLVAELLGSHLEESRSHAPNLESAFSLLGWEIDDSPCPVIEAFERDGEAQIKKADGTVVDGIVLQGAAEVESYEISVYENLILYSQAMNRLDIGDLLRRNAQSERAVLVKIRTLQSELAPVRGAD